MKQGRPIKFYFMKTISTRFNGEDENIFFKTEASSNFSHRDVNALGSYRNSPFVTGSSSSYDGLKTEILDHSDGQWNQVADYPFTNGER